MIRGPGIMEHCCDPLRVNKENFRFLYVFCDLLESWNIIPGRNSKLTKEIFTALHHIIYGFLEPTKYCRKELKMFYILAGKFQIDHLEAKFGQYWQLTGDQLNISIQKALECEKNNYNMLSCLNFWDEAWWFLSLRVFGLLSLSLLLFPQHFGRYNLWPSSGVCQTREPSQNFEVHPLLNPVGGSPVLILLAIIGYKC